MGRLGVEDLEADFGEGLVWFGFGELAWRVLEMVWVVMDDLEHLLFFGEPEDVDLAVVDREDRAVREGDGGLERGIEVDDFGFGIDALASFADGDGLSLRSQSVADLIEAVGVAAGDGSRHGIWA